MSWLTYNRAAVIGLLLLAGALYLPRLNGDWYYLYGEEGPCITLVMSLGAGQGYSDISLPGAPPHVREPFLFFFLVSLLDRVFGLNLWVFKGFVVLSALLLGPAAFLLFRRLAPPQVALAAALLVPAVPSLVDHAAQFRPDFLANTLYVVSLLILEKYREDQSSFTRTALAGAALLLAAYLVRSTALAIALAWPLALALQPGTGSRRRLHLKKALIILAPFALGFGLWEYRNYSAAAQSGLTYAGRYLIGAEPNSLTIMAEDFHAPLHPPWPQATPTQLLPRIAGQLKYYGRTALDLSLNRPPDSTLPAGFRLPALLFLILTLTGYMSSEWRRRSLTSLSLPIYLLAVAAWPMRGPRQIFLFLPFLFLYSLLGLDGALGRIQRRVPRLPARTLVLAAAGLLLVYYLYGDLQIFRQARRIQALPLLEVRPGLSARILSPAQMDSARVLLWARDHLPPGAILMFHSPPPCYLVTGHQCSSIPYEPDRKKVRDYLLNSKVEYVILDGWEREFPDGPAQFAARFLEPTLRAYPENFELVYQEPRSPAAIYRVKKAF